MYIFYDVQFPVYCLCSVSLLCHPVFSSHSKYFCIFGFVPLTYTCSLLPSTQMSPISSLALVFTLPAVWCCVLHARSGSPVCLLHFLLVGMFASAPHFCFVCQEIVWSYTSSLRLACVYFCFHLFSNPDTNNRSQFDPKQR